MSRDEGEATVLALLAQIQEGARLVRRNLGDPGSLETMDQMVKSTRVAMAHLRLLQGESLV